MDGVYKSQEIKKNNHFFLFFDRYQLGVINDDKNRVKQQKRNEQTTKFAFVTNIPFEWMTNNAVD